MRYNKKTYRRKKKAPSRWKVYGAAGSQLARDVAKLKNLINVEFKVKDTSFLVTPNTTGSITYLNLLAQGDGNETRDGAQYRNKSIEIRFNSILTGLVDNCHVRVLLGIHKNVNGTTLTPTDVLEGATPIQPRNYDNQKNVIILKEWNFVQTLTQSNSIVNKKYHTDLDMITRYQQAATANTITGMEQGGLFLMTCSNLTGGPDLNCITRLRFVDN